MLKRLFDVKRDSDMRRLNDSIGKEYAIETHMHTAEASRCAEASGSEMARFYKKLGYSGMIVTDHFFNGNTAIPPHFSWEERVRLFCLGYEEAAREGNRIGLDVFLGWEYGYFGTEFITIGLNKEWLLSSPDVLNWGVEEYLTRVRSDGGFVIHAHPFREAPYIRSQRFFPDMVDAVEVINSRNVQMEWDQKAHRYALEHRLAMTSGSDSHDARVIPNGGMIMSRRPRTVMDIISDFRNGTCPRMIGSERLVSKN